MKLNSIISAVLLASLSTQALAARFYLVTPLTKAESKTAENINVTLQDAQLPAASLTEPYHFDLGSTLSVTGDPAYAAENVSWALVQSDLPAGLSFSPNGIISGVPTARQDAEFDAKATYKAKADVGRYTIVVEGVPAHKIDVALASQALPAGAVSTAYSYDLKQALSVTGDPEYSTAQVTWSATGLPAGMALSADGVLSGTPSASQTASIPVTATYRTKAGSRTYSLVINRADLAKITVALAAVSLPNAEVSTAYSYDLKQALSVTGDPEYSTAQVTWSATGLPAGMALSADGVLSGTPSASQTASIPVTATYRTKAGSRTYSLVINRADPAKITVALAAVSLPNAEVSTAYSYDLKQALSVTGDPEYSTAQVTWSATGLPAGMALSADGVLSGTPSASQTASIPVTATYRTKAGSRTYSLLVNGVNPAKITVSLAAQTLPAGKINTYYAYDIRGALSVSGDPEYSAGKVTWSASGLPAGLTMSGGVVSGTPTAAYPAGTPVSVSANYKGKAGSKTYSLVIAQKLTTSSFSIRTEKVQTGGSLVKRYAGLAYLVNKSGQQLSINAPTYSGAWAPGTELQLFRVDFINSNNPTGVHIATIPTTGQTLRVYWDGLAWSIYHMD